MITSYEKKEKGFVFLTGVFLLFLLISIYTENYYWITVPFVLLFFLFGWHHFYIVFLLLLASLPWSIEYNFSQTLATDFPDEFLMLFVSYLFFAYYFYNQGSGWKEIRKHPLFILFIIHLLWIATSVCFSTSGIISVKYLLAKSWYACAFVLAPLLLLMEKKKLKYAFTLFTISMLFVVIIVLIRHAYTGFTFATINDAVIPFFRNHVNYSAMLVCLVPVLFAFYKLSSARRIKLFFVFALIIVLSAIFFSFSRGAWIALMAGLTAYWLLSRKLLFPGFIAAVIITIILLCRIKNNDRYLDYTHDYKTTIFHKDFREHFIATYKLKDVSTAERFYRWIAGVRMIKDNRITGFGPGTFYSVYKPYTIPAFKTWVSNNPDHSTVHNYFLLITIEQGIPGLVFFLLLLGGMLYYAQVLYHRIQDVFYKTIAITIGSIIMMLVVVNFLSDLIETDKVGSLFFLCLSVLIIADIKTTKKY